MNSHACGQFKHADIFCMGAPCAGPGGQGFSLALIEKQEGEWGVVLFLHTFLLFILFYAGVRCA